METGVRHSLFEGHEPFVESHIDCMHSKGIARTLLDSVIKSRENGHFGFITAGRKTRDTRYVQGQGVALTRLSWTSVEFQRKVFCFF